MRLIDQFPLFYCLTLLFLCLFLYPIFMVIMYMLPIGRLMMLVMCHMCRIFDGAVSAKLCMVINDYERCEQCTKWARFSYGRVVAKRLFNVRSDIEHWDSCKDN